MKIAKHKGLLITGLVVLLVGLWMLPAGAEEDSDSCAPLEKLSGLLDKAKVPLSVAVDTAAKAAKGTAFAAEFEVEDGQATYDILVLVPGTPPKLFEVEIDAATGKVLEIEDESEDDDDGDEDDDDDADDD